MEKGESLEEFYERKIEGIPANFLNEIGHFNVFNLESTPSGISKPMPYKKRDYYKITLVIGDIDIHYADKVMAIRKPTLVFSNPQIPYKSEGLENIKGGFYCIFNQHFFHQYGNLANYEVFQPNQNRFFELNLEQLDVVNSIYAKMFAEIQSDYEYKYDVLRNLVFELLHFAMKNKPFDRQTKKQIDASQRITTLFLELLERQFPVDENHPKVNLRTASEFASQLNIHVNHLNRALQKVTSKSTSKVIAERILQEAKILLKYSNWNISEIAYALRFTEVAHFINFFSKHIGASPLKFRKGN